MIPAPQVSVVMPVYNGELFLRESIESILNQTLPDFEFIIICDPSTDNSLSLVQSYNDSRIILINNENRLGIARCLNLGLETARGKYVVRMDADDISLPERLATQVAFMESHLEVGVCGSWLKIIGFEGGWIRELPVDHDTLKCILVFGCLIAHPTVIMRRDLLIKYSLFYNPAFTYAEDYDLWSRCARYFHLANQSQVVYLYRHHADQASRVFKEQERFSGLVMFEELQHLGVDISDEEFELHKEISVWRIQPNKSFADQTRQWLYKLMEANSRTHYYPEPCFSDMIKKRWITICEKWRFDEPEL